VAIQRVRARAPDSDVLVFGLTGAHRNDRSALVHHGTLTRKDVQNDEKWVTNGHASQLDGSDRA
jgi:hypothetical protein